MRRARIHIYYGTCELPRRELDDQETAHDVIDIDIGESESVKEVELVKQGPVYRQRMETDEEALARAIHVESSRDTVKEIGGTFTGNTSPTPKLVNERVKGYDAYRYRIVTLEEVDHIAVEEGVQEAEVVGELPPQAE